MRWLIIIGAVLAAVPAHAQTLDAILARNRALKVVWEKLADDRRVPDTVVEAKMTAWYNEIDRMCVAAKITKDYPCAPVLTADTAPAWRKEQLDACHAKLSTTLKGMLPGYCERTFGQ